MNFTKDINYVISRFRVFLQLNQLTSAVQTHKESIQYLKKVNQELQFKLEDSKKQVSSFKNYLGLNFSLILIFKLAPQPP